MRFETPSFEISINAAWRVILNSAVHRLPAFLSGRSAAKVAAELGIRAPLLYRWARPKRQANLSGYESKSGRSVEELEAEIRRLRAENAKLLEQREVLKKSLGILSEAPPRSMPESNK